MKKLELISGELFGVECIIAISTKSILVTDETVKSVPMIADYLVKGDNLTLKM